MVLGLGAVFFFKVQLFHFDNFVQKYSQSSKINIKKKETTN